MPGASTRSLVDRKANWQMALWTVYTSVCQSGQYCHAGMLEWWRVCSADMEGMVVALDIIREVLSVWLKHVDSQGGGGTWCFTEKRIVGQISVGTSIVYKACSHKPLSLILSLDSIFSLQERTSYSHPQVWEYHGYIRDLTSEARGHFPYSHEPTSVILRELGHSCSFGCCDSHQRAFALINGIVTQIRCWRVYSPPTPRPLLLCPGFCLHLSITCAASDLSQEKSLPELSPLPSLPSVYNLSLLALVGIPTINFRIHPKFRMLSSA